MKVSSPISSGISRGEVKEVVEAALAASRRKLARPVSFIERKSPHLERLSEILRLSADSGLWTNFGPVSSLLETVVGRHLKLPPERVAVTCSSGTAALFALVSLKEYCAGRSLRWVISAYSFRSTYLGPLARATVLDCDSRGMLDRDALAGLDPDCWDGVVVTNVFGQRSAVRDYIELCRNLGKELIVDNAGLLHGFCRDDSSGPVDEILSFHQTKPWGMGEGGCAIVAREQAEILRAFTNCGSRLEDRARVGAANSKISDFSCALILGRLLEFAEWSAAYRRQAERLLHIALDAGLRLLAPLDLETLSPPHLPMLAPRPIPRSALRNETFVMEKYYQPLAEASRNAWAIYDRIMNLPCHPDMALLSDEEIWREIALFGV